MITIAIQNVWKRDHLSLPRHPEKQILVLSTHQPFLVSSHCIKCFSPKHGGTVRKGNVFRAPHNTRTIARTNGTTLSVDSIIQNPAGYHLRLALTVFRLSLQPV